MGNDLGCRGRCFSEHRVYMLRKLLMAQQRQQMQANEKETAGADDIESKIKKGGFTAGASVHDPSVIKDNDTYYIFGSHMESAKSTDLRNWTGFSSGVNAENKLFDNLFDGEEDGDPAAFTYVGKNEEGGYSVWAPDVIYNKKMGKYVCISAPHLLM